MKLGIIGSGMIGTNFVNDIKFAPKCNFFAVLTRDPANVQHYLELYPNLQVFTDEDEFLNSGIDAVYLATPHPMHIGTGKKALNKKIAVLCEKPMTMCYQDTLELIECAKQNKTLLMEAMWSAFFPAIIKLQELIQNGDLGQVKCAQADFGFYKEFDPSHRLFNKELGGGAALDLGVYPLVFSQFVFGKKPNKININTAIGQTQVDEFGAFMLEYEQGEYFQGSFGLHAMLSNEGRVYTDKCTIRLENFWHPSHINIKWSCGKEEVIDCSHDGMGLQFELNAFIDSWEKGETENPLMPFSHSLERAELVDQIINS